MKRNWTTEQLDAIYTSKTDDNKGRNLLVSAAAGSGKTAVLVERIINKIIPSKENPNPTDIDKLLVVTFTNAAAGEMKERILDSLCENIKIAEEKNDIFLLKHLKRQSALLHSANITTIDAFCIRMIRDFFHILGIDPNFGIADQSQLALLSEEALEDMFEDAYESENKDFLLLLDMFSNGNDEDEIANIITRIYTFSRALPNPDKWLRDNANMFKMTDCEENPWVKMLLEKSNDYAKSACKKLEKALEKMIKMSLGEVVDVEKTIDAYTPGEENELQFNWGNHYEITANEYLFAKGLIGKSWDEMKNSFDAFVFEALNKARAVRDKEKEINDPETKEFVKLQRDEAKKLLQNIREYFKFDINTLSVQMRENLYPVALAIVNMVGMYEEYFKKKKEKKNILDFADTEQLCHKLFSEFDEVREEVKAKYDEILIDEYQDTNGLQEAIFSLISKGDNLFVVGDVKQSIYRFRQSDSSIFQERNQRYSLEGNAVERKIILSKNFRSRSEVLESINAVFKSVMSIKTGGVEYDDTQKLYTGNESYENVNKHITDAYKSECYILDSDFEDDEEEYNRTVLEAGFIANRILKLKKEGFLVFDKGEYRPIENRDIVILMSSHKAVADVYTRELLKREIECYAESKGYFEKLEVKLMMSILKVIQNPYQDIPLLSLLRSPIVNIADDELVAIRSADKNEFYQALLEYSKKDDALSLKCRDFIKRLDEWRGYAEYMSIDKLIWTLYEETGIYALVGALFGADEARANLRLLFERAKQYEESGFCGLFHFIRYIERLKERSDEIESAKLVGEGNNVVKIMTIHKSKGLEFPVVFLAGCSKKFHQSAEQVVLHNKLGFGLDYINTQENYKIKNISKMAVSAINSREDISEEERKLYVALTRAKEKLIVTGVVGNKKGNAIEEKNKLWERILPDENGVMDPFDAYSVTGFIDWIAPVARKRKDVWSYKEITDKNYLWDYENPDAEAKAEEDIKITPFEYPYDDLKTIPTKISVTALKNMNSRFEIAKQDVIMAEAPLFLKKEKVSSLEKGTAFHLAMQKILPKENMDEEYVEAELLKLVKTKELLPEEKETIDSKKILKFYNSEIGKRIIKSEKIYKEASFNTEIPLSMFEGFSSEEEILLQGIVDCYFEEDGELVIVDYKTDFYNHPDELVLKYEKQLFWYAYALEKITGKKVKEKYIYMFYNDDFKKV